jgi:sporulation protein YlmC with PRC-barrel domain
MKIDIGARVRTLDGREVHRVVVDLDYKVVTGVVVLKGRLLSRDVLVPLDFIDRVDGDTVVLRLNADQLEQLPEFAYNEILAPPPAWTLAGVYPDGSVLIPIRQRKRLGEHHVDLTPGTRVLATDGEAGRVDEVELDPTTGELDAFWIRAGRLFAQDVRVPVEWVERVDAERVVRRLTGVRGVTNLIKVKARPTPSELKKKIEDALVRRAETDAQRIQVQIALECGSRAAKSFRAAPSARGPKSRRLNEWPGPRRASRKSKIASRSRSSHHARRAAAGMSTIRPTQIMAVVRWKIPAASISEAVADKLLSWDGAHHVIYVNKAQSTMSVRREGDALIVQTEAEAPLDNLKSHLRYMIAFALGGTEESA